MVPAYNGDMRRKRELPPVEPADRAIPSTLAPFFQEYDLASLELQTAAPLIFERTLQYGDCAELHWLFAQYPRQQIHDWVRRFGKERLPHPHLDFWQIVLDFFSPTEDIPNVRPAF
jgi:hypothetical protein